MRWNLERTNVSGGVEREMVEVRGQMVLPEWSSAPLGAWGVYRAELRGSPRIHAFLEALV